MAWGADRGVLGREYGSYLAAGIEQLPPAGPA